MALQLKALNLLNKAKTKFHKISSQIVGSSSNMMNYTIKAAIGSPEKTLSALNVKVLAGQSQNEFASMILKGLNIGTDVPAVIIRLQVVDPMSTMEKAQNLIEQAIAMAQAMIPDPNASELFSLIQPSFGVDGDQVVIGISLDHPLVVSLVQNYLETINVILGDDGKVEFEADFGLNFDINTIFDNKDKNMSDIIGKGFHLNLGLKISEHLRDKYIKLLEKANELLAKNERAGVKFINKSALAFLLRSFSLEIIAKDFEDLSLKVAGTALAPVIAGPHTIGNTLDSWKNDFPPISIMAADMPIIQEAVDFLKLCQGQGSISFLIPRVSVNIGWKSQGGSKIFEHFN